MVTLRRGLEVAMAYDIGIASNLLFQKRKWQEIENIEKITKGNNDFRKVLYSFEEVHNFPIRRFFSFGCKKD